jgi:DNA-binding transcriptional regulator LsrR (DeoR family)
VPKPLEEMHINDETAHFPNLDVARVGIGTMGTSALLLRCGDLRH